MGKRGRRPGRATREGGARLVTVTPVPLPMMSRIRVIADHMANRATDLPKLVMWFDLRHPLHRRTPPWGRKKARRTRPYPISPRLLRTPFTWPPHDLHIISICPPHPGCALRTAPHVGSLRRQRMPVRPARQGGACDDHRRWPAYPVGFRSGSEYHSLRATGIKQAPGRPGSRPGEGCGVMAALPFFPSNTPRLSPDGAEVAVSPVWASPPRRHPDRFPG